nr:accessory Sec system protein Asp2 [Secundilactobacillus similis]
MRTIKVVQIGGLRCDLSDTLAPEFKYYWIANDRVVDADNKLAPFEDGRLKPGFRTAIFLIAPGSRLLDDTELVAQLPAYQVIYDEHLVLAPDIEALLDVKAAQAMALLQPETVAHAINDDYFGGQTGYKLNFNEVRITPNFTGQVRQEGHNRMLYTGSFGNQPQQLLNWRQRGFVMIDYQVTVLPEAAVLSGDVTISFKFYLVDRDTNQVNKVIEKTFDDLQEPFQLPQSDKVQFVYVTVWAQERDKSVSVIAIFDDHVGNGVN